MAIEKKGQLISWPFFILYMDSVGLHYRDKRCP